MDLQTIIFSFLGGLGIFLFSIQSFGNGLQHIAGDRLRNILDRYTKNPFIAVFAGMVVAALIQTSAGTTVLTIGLVNAGFLTLKQAIGVIIGANIGTTTTAFIIGMNITDYSLPILFIGAALLFFFKNKRFVHLGQVIFGFGGLFFGLRLMSDGLKRLGEWQLFENFTLNIAKYPVLGVFIGIFMTMLIQSSGASIGILQSLYEQGALTLQAALPILFGDNIGTTLTPLLAAFGASLTAKRVALSHVLMNVVGVIFVLIAIVPFTKLLVFLEEVLSLNEAMTIAFAHGMFNVSNALIQLPFISLLALLVTKLIRGEEQRIEYRTNHLDFRFISRSPSFALSQAKKEVLKMAEIAEKGLKEAALYFKNGEKQHADIVLQYEEVINRQDRNITEYLTQVSSRSLSGHDSTIHSQLMNIVRDIERIGDHLENMIELKNYQITNKVPLSKGAYDDVDDMFTLTGVALRKALEALGTNRFELTEEVKETEMAIDQLERLLRKKHIVRVSEGKCSGQAGIVFVDMLSNLERIGDHAANIAQAVSESHE